MLSLKKLLISMLSIFTTSATIAADTHDFYCGYVLNEQDLDEKIKVELAWCKSNQCEELMQTTLYLDAQKPQLKGMLKRIKERTVTENMINTLCWRAEKSNPANVNAIAIRSATLGSTGDGISIGDNNPPTLLENHMLIE